MKIKITAKNKVSEYLKGNIGEITKEFSIGRLKMRFNMRSKNNLWGRFGGGWNFNLGIQIGGKTIILNCIIFTLRFYWRKNEI